MVVDMNVIHTITARLRSLSPIELTLLPVLAFLGLGWLRAGSEKLIDLDWWTGQYLSKWLVDHQDTAISVFPLVSDYVFSRLTPSIAFIVMGAQFFIGYGLLTGRSMRPALQTAIALNLCFVVMGEVTPSAFYLVIELSLLTGLNLGLIGNDPRPPNHWRAFGWMYAAAFVLPEISTIHPEEVIHDPALMIGTIAALAFSVEAIRIFQDQSSTRFRNGLPNESGYGQGEFQPVRVTTHRDSY